LLAAGVGGTARMGLRKPRQGLSVPPARYGKSALPMGRTKEGRPGDVTA